ncbi:TPA: thermonuclease family protein [Staphylococcus pseudintermedius]
MNKEIKWYQNGKSGFTILFILTIVAFAVTFFINVENALATTEKSKVTSSKAAQPGTTERFPVELVKAVDGDTAKLKYQGKTETFRFLLIDTPETKHPRLGKQPFGQEASDRTAELLKNANKIEVEFDVGRKQDKYHRYLAYIYVDGQMVNNILVKEGLAKVDYVYPPNTRYLSQLEKSQKEAKKAKLGIWSLNSAFEDEINENDTTNMGSLAS